MNRVSTYDEEFTRSCTPGFWNNEGNVDSEWRTALADNFGAGPPEYRRLLQDRLTEIANMT